MTWSQRTTQAMKKSGKGILSMLPILLGVLLLTSILAQYITDLLHTGLFGYHPITDAAIGAGIGGIAAGQPVISYLLGGELLSNGVGIAGVSAFVISWVTIGVTNLPLEIRVFGSRFAIFYHLTSFILACLFGLLTAGMLNVLS